MSNSKERASSSLSEEFKNSLGLMKNVIENNSESGLDSTVLIMLKSTHDSVTSIEKHIAGLKNVQLCKFFDLRVPQNLTQVKKEQKEQSKYFQPVNNSAICKGHQLYGSRNNSCPKRCHWDKIKTCPRHRRYGGKSWICESPNTCEFECTLKKILN